MTVHIEYLTGKKGSNPGGKVRVYSDTRRENGQEFDGYLKYCFVPKTLQGTPFTAAHQPVYEAATFQLARLFGLHVPEFFVLLNGRQDVIFEKWKENGERDPHGRRYYFVSKWLACPLDDQDRKTECSRASAIVKEELPFLDALHVSDISGKRQNFLLCEGVNGSPKVFYVDLGCSFVRAVDGRLRKPMKVRGMAKAHDLKLAEKQLGKYGLITADDDTIIPLESLPLAIRNMALPTLNPKGKASLSDLVSPPEVEEMEKDIVYNFSKSLHKLEGLNVLVNLNSH